MRRKKSIIPRSVDWRSNLEALTRCVGNLSVRDARGREIEPDLGFAIWKRHIQDVRSLRNSVFLVGNGASASMASHIAADLAKNAHVRTEVFSDLSLITAVANDISYEEVFAEPLRRRMLAGDALVAISSSGRSPNVLRAVSAATNLAGLTVTLSAMNEDNPLRSSGWLNFYVPANTYGLAETSHAAILHHLVDLMTADLDAEWAAGESGLKLNSEATPCLV